MKSERGRGGKMKEEKEGKGGKRNKYEDGALNHPGTVTPNESFWNLRKDSSGNS